MKSKAIPILNPSQFDDYIFSNWQSPVDGFFDKFHIERIENYKNNLKLPLAPHRRSVYFFLFITKGKAIRSKGLTNYEIESNHFFFLPADQITTIEYVSDDVEGYYCHFNLDIFNQSILKIDLAKEFSFLQLTAEPLLKLIQTERILQLLEILFEENEKNQPNRFDLIPLYLITLFSELKYLSQPVEQSVNNASTYLTQRYKTALSELIYEKKSVQEFADYLSVTPNHLHKCVKATTGKSAHKLLEDMRILEAKVLLKQSRLSIGEIEYKIGKFEPSDFSRFFKSRTNISPKQYRLSNA
jgi:AraC family transcriptional regulator, transcriptional activator of pobA